MPLGTYGIGECERSLSTESSPLRSEGTVLAGQESLLRSEQTTCRKNISGCADGEVDEPDIL